MQQNLPADIANTPLALPLTRPAANAATTHEGWKTFLFYKVHWSYNEKIDMIVAFSELIESVSHLIKACLYSATCCLQMIHITASYSTSLQLVIVICV